MQLYGRGLVQVVQLVKLYLILERGIFMSMSFFLTRSFFIPIFPFRRDLLTNNIHAMFSFAIQGKRGGIHGNPACENHPSSTTRKEVAREMKLK